MTGYTVHTGSTEAFSSGWDNIFGGKSRQSGAKKAAGTKAAAKKTAAKATRPAAKKAAKKAARRK